MLIFMQILCQTLPIVYDVLNIHNILETGSVFEMCMLDYTLKNVTFHETLCAHDIMINRNMFCYRSGKFRWLNKDDFF